MSWLDNWEAEGVPQWAVHRQVVGEVEKYLDGTFKSAATPAEINEYLTVGQSDTFNARLAARFPGYLERLEKQKEEYRRLRAFELGTSEDFMCKDAEEMVRFAAICASIAHTVFTEANAVLQDNIFTVPSEVETHEDL